jgi:pimeloyl-ACP methyl ester carboxylesterase
VNLKSFVASSDTATLHGTDSGAGLPVVFLHAGVADSRMWASQIEAVTAAGFRAVAYDRRGFGGEPDLPDEVMPLIEAMEIAEERGDLEMLGKVEAHAWLDGPLSRNGRVSGAVRDLFLAMNGAVLAKPALTQEEEPLPAIDDLAEITAPVLLAVGGLDFPHIISRHDELSEAFENAFAAVIEDTAHLPPLERPDLFNPLLLEFLAAITGGEEG